LFTPPISPILDLSIRPNLSDRRSYEWKGESMKKFTVPLSVVCALVVFFQNPLFGQWQMCAGSDQYGTVNSLALVGGKLAAATTTGGVMVSPDAGAHWSVSASGFGSNFVTALLTQTPFASSDGRSIIAGTTDGVYLSADTGHSWDNRNVNLSGSGFSVTSLSAYRDFILAGFGGNGLYLVRTNTENSNWSQVSPYAVNAIHFCGYDVSNSGASMFAATEGHGLIMSRDSGKTWAAAGLQGSSVQSVQGVTHSVMVAGADAGYCFSLDTGKTFTTQNAGFTSTPVVSAFFVSQPYVVVATRNEGVYIGIGWNPSTWYGYNTGLGTPVVTSLVSDGKYLYAGTDAGVWRRPMTEVVAGVNATEPTLPEGAMLRQNYPNPFNPSTVVSCRLPVSSHVRVGVYDMLGREAAVLFEGSLEAGEHEWTFDGAGLPSGVYFCRMTTRESTHVIRMVLMK
jgi:hypothetical protein